jgi:hypothetical protein
MKAWSDERVKGAAAQVLAALQTAEGKFTVTMTKTGVHPESYVEHLAQIRQALLGLRRDHIMLLSLVGALYEELEGLEEVPAGMAERVAERMAATCAETAVQVKRAAEKKAKEAPRIQLPGGPIPKPPRFDNGNNEGA